MSDNEGSAPEADAAARTRRSGRVVKAPQKFADDAALSTAPPKRKRTQADDDDGSDTGASESDEEMSDDEGAASEDPDTTPKARKQAPASRAGKPSLKKPKINGTQSAAAAQFNGLPTRPKKSVRIEAGEKGSGLFGEPLCTPP